MFTRELKTTNQISLTSHQSNNPHIGQLSPPRPIPRIIRIFLLELDNLKIFFVLCTVTFRIWCVPVLL